MLWIGIASVVFVLLVAGVVWLRVTTPSRFPLGTRAFEAEMTLEPLKAAIAHREQERAATADEKRSAKLLREIAYLERQVVDLQRIVDARDLSPGKGYIGFQAPPADV